tara:strand:+ start:204 stop:314 length:111 start_codon:yes stop_codon:yes gene_type:complete
MTGLNPNSSTWNPTVVNLDLQTKAEEETVVASFFQF